ncbi:uncharacterized protein EAF02_000884 [Botrytis sinoallii]|uniref:uncharacterized protein n=1 Tax=Botrytis sinoallii TaxID=1463999 RepID=UPI001900630E|nr:uncharacterized protein EAF02_000884 [Botrytis sinoallii]KAF7893346.1 hypothetical protein EAF02_000884 [Botrytis sinoallii]
MAIRAMNREQNSDLDTNCGRFDLRDTAELTNYSRSERRQAKAASKLPSEMGFQERPAFQKAGAEVLIKVRPDIVAPVIDSVNRNHQFRQEDNIAFRAGT